MYSFFVSSTFKDMQGERDAIHRQVMPRLRELAAEYGQSVQFVDLRWGISTSDLDQEDAQKKILKVCLSEIDKCVPYMFVLLGERYGWSPGSELIGKAAAEAGFAPEYTDMSITELEIQYGLWRNRDQLDRVIFCFRDDLDLSAMPEEMREIYASGDESDRACMQRLKARIQAEPGAHIVRYGLEWDAEKGRLTGYDRFADRIGDELESMLTSVWVRTEARSWLEKQQEQDRLKRENLLNSFVGMEKTRGELRKAIEDSKLLVIEGEEGSGKSSMMTILSEDLKDSYDTEIVYCGSELCSNTRQLMKILSYRFRGNDGSEGAVESSISAEEAKRIWDKKGNIAVPRKRVLFIDGIDHLVADEARKFSYFIPFRIQSKLRIVVSTDPSVQLNRGVIDKISRNRSLDYRKIPLDKPGASDKRAFINRHFELEHKQITAPVMEKLLYHRLSDNLICLEVMVKWLSGLNSYDFAEIAKLEKTLGDGGKAIEAYLLGQVEAMPRDPESFIDTYVHKVAHFLSEEDTMEENGFSDDFFASVIPLYYMSLTHHGLSRDQLNRLHEFTVRKLFPEGSDHPLTKAWNELLFTRMRRYMGDLLVDRADGRVDFAHELIRKTLRSTETAKHVSVVFSNYLSCREDLYSDTVLEDLFNAFCVSLDELDTEIWKRDRRRGPERRQRLSDFAVAVQLKIDRMEKDAVSYEAGETERARLKKLKESVREGIQDEKHLGYARGLLMDVAQFGGRPCYRTMEFFWDITAEGRFASLKEKMTTHMIRLTITASLYKASVEDEFHEYTHKDKKQLLTWMQSCMGLYNLLDDKNLNFRDYGSYFAFCGDYAARCLAWFDGQKIVHYRCAKIYLEAALYEAFKDRKKSESWLRLGLEQMERLESLNRSGEDENEFRFFYAYLAKVAANVFLRYGQSTSFVSKKMYLHSAWKRTMDGLDHMDGAEDPKNEYLEVRLELILCQALIHECHRKYRDAADVLYGEYVKYGDADVLRCLPGRARISISKIGAKLAYHALFGCLPVGKDGNAAVSTEELLCTVQERERNHVFTSTDDSSPMIFSRVILMMIEAYLKQTKEEDGLYSVLQDADEELSHFATYATLRKDPAASLDASECSRWIKRYKEIVWGKQTSRYLEHEKKDLSRRK